MKSRCCLSETSAMFVSQVWTPLVTRLQESLLNLAPVVMFETVVTDRNQTGFVLWFSVFFFQFETKIYILQVRFTQYEYLGDLSTLSFAIRSFNAWFNSPYYHPHPHPPSPWQPKGYKSCPSCREWRSSPGGRGTGQINYALRTWFMFAGRKDNDRVCVGLAWTKQSFKI